jgi:hypothetical protein
MASASSLEKDVTSLYYISRLRRLDMENERLRAIIEEKDKLLELAAIHISGT